MKRWKKYVLCVMCVCCFGLLTGCGNRNDSGSNESNRGTERNGTTIVTEQENAAGSERGNAATEDDLVNNATDQNTDSIGGSIGDAADDLIDGAGEAGKDVIDGMENASDALTGNDSADSSNDRNESETGNTER